MNALIAVLLFGAVVGVAALLLARRTPTVDQAGLAQLRRAGADLTVPHDIDHWLYFRMREGADAAAERMRQHGYSIVAIVLTPRQWQVHARIRMVPGKREIKAAGAFLEGLAAEHDGHYDSWGTTLLK